MNIKQVFSHLASVRPISSLVEIVAANNSEGTLGYILATAETSKEMRDLSRRLIIPAKC